MALQELPPEAFSEAQQGGRREEETTIAKPAALVTTPPIQRQAYLTILNGRTAGKTYKLGSSETVIGRGQDGNIILDDTAVSRRHCSIQRRAGELEIQDLSSTNGTYCNGEPVTRRILADGDRLHIGTNIILKFHYRGTLEEAYYEQLYESTTRGLALVREQGIQQGRLEEARSLLCSIVRHRLGEVPPWLENWAAFQDDLHKLERAVVQAIGAKDPEDLRTRLDS